MLNSKLLPPKICCKNIVIVALLKQKNNNNCRITAFGAQRRMGSRPSGPITLNL